MHGVANFLQMYFFKQALEQQGKREQEKLHVEEKKLEQKKAAIELEIQALQEELKAIMLKKEDYNKKLNTFMEKSKLV